MSGVCSLTVPVIMSGRRGQRLRRRQEMASASYLNDDDATASVTGSCYICWRPPSRSLSTGDCAAAAASTLNWSGDSTDRRTSDTLRHGTWQAAMTDYYSGHAIFYDYNNDDRLIKGQFNPAVISGLKWKADSTDRLSEIHGFLLPSGFSYSFKYLSLKYVLALRRSLL